MQPQGNEATLFPSDLTADIVEKAITERWTFQEKVPGNWTWLGRCGCYASHGEDGGKKMRHNHYPQEAYFLIGIEEKIKESVSGMISGVARNARKTREWVINFNWRLGF